MSRSRDVYLQLFFSPASQCSQFTRCAASRFPTDFPAYFELKGQLGWSCLRAPVTRSSADDERTQLEFASIGSVSSCCSSGGTVAALVPPSAIPPTQAPPLPTSLLRFGRTSSDAAGVFLVPDAASLAASPRISSSCQPASAEPRLHHSGRVRTQG